MVGGFQGESEKGAGSSTRGPLATLIRPSLLVEAKPFQRSVEERFCSPGRKVGGRRKRNRREGDKKVEREEAPGVLRRGNRGVSLLC